jgi:hypothetical protein
LECLSPRRPDQQSSGTGKQGASDDRCGDVMFGYVVADPQLWDDHMQSMEEGIMSNASWVCD